MNKQKLTNFITEHRNFFKKIFRLFNKCPLNNKFFRKDGEKVRTDIGLSLLKGCRIVNQGVNNKIIIGDYSRVQNCSVVVSGSNNTILIGDHCFCKQATFCIEDDNNMIEIGDRTSLCGTIQLAAIEGTSIKIGKECLFSSGIDIRTGDSHSLIQQDTGKRINPSASVEISDHVWCGANVTILKGTYVANNCMIGATSLLCKRYDKPHCVVAGLPAKEVKEEIDWLTERINVS